MPNVRYYRNLFNVVVARDWEYEDAGILDRTHLRFFTFKSLYRTLDQAGFQIRKFEGINNGFGVRLELWSLASAAFAYGRASHIVTNIGGVLEAMGPSPAEYVRAVDADEARSRFKAFRHRFHKSEDLVGLLERISGVLRAHGSLGSLFRSVYREEEKDISGSLSRFVRKILECGPATAGPALKRLEYLLSSPSDGSACKRMNLYLRWMVRRTSPDLGLWTFVEPSRLLIPVDTHVHRISTFLGLNHRKSADWQAARGITDQLSRFDPADPVRYDFALCRLGILDLCSRKRRKEQCDVCLLRDVCRFPVA